MPAPTPPRTPNRPATEAALQRAAIELLERHGVLAGLNLREVAQEAGVNRGRTPTPATPQGSPGAAAHRPDRG